MQRIHVESSQIRSIGYDPETLRMQVEFTPGSVYEYAGIERETHLDFMASESKGKFFGARIKTNPEKYPFQKVRPSDREIEKYRKDGLEWNSQTLIWEKQEAFV